jgi:hypothetical protein
MARNDDIITGGEEGWQELRPPVDYKRSGCPDLGACKPF